MLHEGSPSSLCASFEFIKDLDLYKQEKPYRLTIFNLETGFDVEHTNIKTEWVTDVKVHDVRNHNGELSLDEDGFKYFIHETLLGTRFEDDKFDEDIEAMTIFVKNELQAEKAIRTDFRIREPSAVKHELRNRATETRATPTGAATLVHTDHTLNEGLRFVKDQLNPVEREKYLSGEYYYRIINLWKPLIDVIEDNPLGLLDPRSVKPCDILEADNITNKWEGEIFLIKHNSEQRWWYLSKQKRNELWLFVAFDSRMERQLTCKPFVAPETS